MANKVPEGYRDIGAGFWHHRDGCIFNQKTGETVRLRPFINDTLCKIGPLPIISREQNLSHLQRVLKKLGHPGTRMGQSLHRLPVDSERPPEHEEIDDNWIYLKEHGHICYWPEGEQPMRVVALSPTEDLVVRAMLDLMKNKTPIALDLIKKLNIASPYDVVNFITRIRKKLEFAGAGTIEKTSDCYAFKFNKIG